MSDLDRAVAAIARDQHGCVNRQQLEPLGASPRKIEHRLLSGEWLAMERGVYALSSSQPTWRRDVMAAVLGKTRAIASGRTAATLHRLPGFSNGKPEITVPSSGSARSRLAIVRRRVDFTAIDKTVVDAIPTATVAETLFDLSYRTHPFRLRRAVDHALVRDLATATELHNVLDRIAGSRLKGTVAFRAVLDGIDDRYVPTESDTELLLKKALADPRVPPIEWQVRLPWWEELPHRIDAVINEWRLVLEADGRTYHTKREDFERDRDRDNLAAADGYRVMRFTYEMLRERPGRVLELVLAAGSRASGTTPHVVVDTRDGIRSDPQ